MLSVKQCGGWEVGNCSFEYNVVTRKIHLIFAKPILNSVSERARAQERAKDVSSSEVRLG